MPTISAVLPRGDAGDAAIACPVGEASGRGQKGARHAGLAVAQLVRDTFVRRVAVPEGASGTPDAMSTPVSTAMNLPVALLQDSGQLGAGVGVLLGCRSLASDLAVGTSTASFTRP